MICVQPNASARFHFIRFGGVAHQTSLRSRSIMMSYSNSPHSGRRVAYSITRSLRCRTIGVIWHSRMGVLGHVTPTGMWWEKGRRTGIGSVSLNEKAPDAYLSHGALLEHPLSSEAVSSA